VPAQEGGLPVRVPLPLRGLGGAGAWAAGLGVVESSRESVVPHVYYLTIIRLRRASANMYSRARGPTSCNSEVHNSSVLYLGRPAEYCSLERDHAAEGDEGRLELLGVLLGHVLLEDLGERLDELLRLDERQVRDERLHLLDDLGLRRGVERLKLDVEDRLLLRLLL
jgi:hypothetical protein